MQRGWDQNSSFGNFVYLISCVFQKNNFSISDPKSLSITWFSWKTTTQPWSTTSDLHWGSQKRRHFVTRLPRQGLYTNALFLGVEPKIGGFPWKWMVKIMEKPIKHGMIWGENPLFLETPICWWLKKSAFLLQDNCSWYSSNQASPATSATPSTTGRAWVSCPCVIKSNPVCCGEQCLVLLLKSGQSFYNR